MIILEDLSIVGHTGVSLLEAMLFNYQECIEFIFLVKNLFWDLYSLNMSNFQTDPLSSTPPENSTISTSLGTMRKIMDSSS